MIYCQTALPGFVEYSAETDLIQLLIPLQHFNAETNRNAPLSAPFTHSTPKTPKEASEKQTSKNTRLCLRYKRTTWAWWLTWSPIRRCTAGRSRHSSGEAGRDRSEAWPWSSMAGSLRNTTGWAPTRWAGWSAPPRSGKWPRNASSYLWSSGKRNRHWTPPPRWPKRVCSLNKPINLNIRTKIKLKIKKIKLILKISE